MRHPRFKERADEAKIRWDIVGRNCRCTRTWPPPRQLRPPLSLSAEHHHILHFPRTSLSVIRWKMLYALDYWACQSPNFWWYPHQISSPNWVSFVVLDGRCLWVNMSSGGCVLHQPMGLSRAHARTFPNRHSVNNNMSADICYTPRT